MLFSIIFLVYGMCNIVSYWESEGTVTTPSGNPSIAHWGPNI